MLKKLNIFSFRTNGPVALELGMWHWVPKYYQDCSNDDLGLTLTYFTARSNMGKCLYIEFHGSFEDFGLEIVIGIDFMRT